MSVDSSLTGDNNDSWQGPEESHPWEAVERYRAGPGDKPSTGTSIAIGT